MVERPFIVIGGGGHAKVVIALLLARGSPIQGYVETDPSAVHQILGLPCLGGDDRLAECAPDAVDVALGVGGTEARSRIFVSWRARGYAFPALVHPAAFVDAAAGLSAGVQVMAGAVVQAAATVGENALLNTGCRIDHDCRIGDGAAVAPGAVLCGGVTVGAGAMVGANATILPGLQIGNGATVAAGAVVIEDVAPGARVAGVPARRMQP